MSYATKLFLYLFCLIFLAACQNNLSINKKYQAKGQDSRIQYIVLHYTAADFDRSVYLLTTQNVSSHYLIAPDSGKIYQLVDDNQRAWHAGLSYWQGRTFLNSSALGIEIVNKGFKDTPEGRIWYPYTKVQISAVIQLLKHLKEKYHIAPENILGHSDIAPQRKTDPGPLFPWRQLAKEGLIKWPDEQAVANQETIFKQSKLPDVSWYQQKLAAIGYEIPQTRLWDKETQNVISAFQMKYQPEDFSGTPNAKTAALIEVILLKKFAVPL